MRPNSQFNPKLATGKVEVAAQSLEILNKADTPAFPIDDYKPVSEEVRLKHRTIDLRRPEVQARLLTRAKISHTIREYMDKQGFLDIETPMLTRATPEGARDYLVPSRVHPGQFYALPQSPQLFKQLLMVSGFDRYYQIVKCFRDEDLRADRQPEFTQIDIEASFVEQEDIISLATGLIRHLFKTVIDVEFPETFPHMTYADAMQKYGSDKPDLRIPLEFCDIDDIVKDVEFKVFSGPANDEAGRVVALKLPQGSEKLTRKQIDDYEKFVKIYGAKGLAYIKVNDCAAGVDGLQSPILKFLTPEVCEAILERTQAETSDIIFFGADHHYIVNAALGALRQKIGHDLNLFTCKWAPVWITDFPMFEYTNERWYATHHPFTSPSITDIAEFKKTPEAKLLSKAYDLALNGYELGGGSIRIHDRELQMAVFEKLGITPDEAQEKFGFLLNAFKHGAPPHGGIAFGLDRITMLMTGTDNIRDVIAFPKTQTATCLLTDAPSEIDSQQLKELHIRAIKVTKE